MVEKFAGVLAEFRRDLGQPDHGFDGFDLAEKGAGAGEGVGAPVLEQALGGGGDLPLRGVWQPAPGVHVLADFVDDS